MITILDLWFLFQLLLLCQTLFYCNPRDVEGHQNFLLREHVFIWHSDHNLFLWAISMLCIFSVSQYLDEEIFSKSLVFSGVALLNWFTKSSKFETGFNDNELLWSFSRFFHYVMLLSLWVFVQQARKFLLLDKELKGKIVLQHSMHYQDSSQFWRYL